MFSQFIWYWLEMMNIWLHLPAWCATLLFCYALNPNLIIPCMESYRNKACLQLRFISAKTESCLPLYIVSGSHRLDCEIERSTGSIAREGLVLSCIVILLLITVIRLRASVVFSRKGFHVKSVFLFFVWSTFCCVVLQQVVSEPKVSTSVRCSGRLSAALPGQHRRSVVHWINKP